jgi:serine/threonine protein kinase
MTPTGPWSENWDIVEPLGKGGQGTTFIANRKSDGQKGVVKILKHQDSDEARRRMHREVSNLKTLHGAGCKVPQIFDGNTDQFESSSIDLFFVMEVISGQRLCDVVGEKGVDFNKSILLVKDLLETIKKALVEDVIHRDLKPENIIIRNFEANDVVIVDYGLSFNATQDGDVTRASETLDNSFFSLPERRVVGGNRRDPRSDLSSFSLWHHSEPLHSLC